MEQSSCQSEPIPSDQSELDSDDSAFAKTPIRPDDDDDSASEASDMSSVSSDASTHLNNHGDRTYFHVWSDMLTCNEMTQLDRQAEDEVPNYVEGDEIDNPNIHKPLSVDTSLPCPLIQFGPIPKRRSSKLQKSEKTTKPSPKAAEESELAGDISKADPADGHSCSRQRDEPADASSESGHQHHDERCCDFSVVAAKNKARHKLEARMRRLERKRLVRY